MMPTLHDGDIVLVDLGRRLGSVGRLRRVLLAEPAESPPLLMRVLSPPID